MARKISSKQKVTLIIIGCVAALFSGTALFSFASHKQENLIARLQAQIKQELYQDLSQDIDRIVKRQVKEEFEVYMAQNKDSSSQQHAGLSSSDSRSTETFDQAVRRVVREVFAKEWRSLSQPHFSPS